MTPSPDSQNSCPEAPDSELPNSELPASGSPFSGQISPELSAPTLKSLWRDPMMLLAFGFGSGLSPKAPGTAGSLLALLCMPILTYLPVWAYWCMLVLAFGAGVVICNYADRRLTGHDHPGIVWDEFVGLWLALASVPASWGWWLAGFLVFRCFDIFKPWPISVIDRKIAGGFGVMLDDLIAGCGAWLVTMTLVWLL